MILTSPHKTTLSSLILGYTGFQVHFQEEFSDTTLLESEEPNKKLTVVMFFMENNARATFFAVVPDISQQSVDIAYERFLGAMRTLLIGHRRPFGDIPSVNPRN